MDKNSSRERQTALFTAVNPMHKNHKDPQELDLTKPRLASYHPLRHTSSLLYLESDCDEISRFFYQKVYVSPRPPPNISYKDNWMCDLDSDIAGSSKDTQRIEQKPKSQFLSAGRPACGERKSRNVPRLIVTLNQEKHEVIDPNEYAETLMWIRIHTTLRVDT